MMPLAVVTFMTHSTPYCVELLERHTWSIEYHCVVYQHRHESYPDRWEATCLVLRPEDDFRGAEAFSERDIAEVDMQDVARRALSLYWSLFGGVADGLNLRY
jgi:hypothetical protein